MRVLHLDDDRDILEITRLSFEIMGGFEVLQCTSGKEAIEKAEAFRPDVLLLDVQMPESAAPLCWPNYAKFPPSPQLPRYS